MRVRNKRRKHYVKHGWKKIAHAYIDWQYEFVFETGVATGDNTYQVTARVEKKAGRR